MTELGFEWVSTMGIGTGCRVHLNAHDLPFGRLVVRVSKHLCAVIDGVVHDTYDPSRAPSKFWDANGNVVTIGGRCVYGYWRLTT